MSIDFRPYLDDVPISCQACEWQGSTPDVQPIENFEIRVAPGEPVPPGQCPECQALCRFAPDPEAETDPEQVLDDAKLPMLRALEGVAYQIREEGALEHLAGEPWAKSVIKAIDLANGRSTES